MMRTPAPREDLSTRPSPPSSGLVSLPDPASVALPFAPGDVIAGKYEIIKVIGSGGMGYVVSATHVELGEVVALKFLRPEALQIPELVERFAREARAAAKIRSEHVARVFDVGTLPDGVPFIVMEHLAGQDLADVLAQGGPLPVKVAVEYVMQACEALAAAHAAGVVHRDIKPENLFLTRHAQGLDFIKILDFGISKVALTPGGKRAFVRTMMPIGSPVYMSPEQIRSSDSVDARTDIWSLGCVLFELLTGTAVFDEPTLMQLSAAILEQEPVPLRALLPDAPPELEEVVLRCLEKDASKRYGNIAEVAIALYPFAPRRSRISAERCYHALKNAGVECIELDLQSVFPPSLLDAVAPSSRSPHSVRMTVTTPQINGARSLARDKTPADAEPASVVHPVVDAPRSAGRRASTESAAELASPRPGKKLRVVGAIALLGLAAALGITVLRARSLGASSLTESELAAHRAAPEAQEPTALATAARSGSTSAPIDLDALPLTPPGVNREAHTTEPRPAKTVPSNAPRRVVPPGPFKSPSARKQHTDDEVDVGY